MLNSKISPLGLCAGLLLTQITQGQTTLFVDALGVADTNPGVGIPFGRASVVDSSSHLQDVTKDPSYPANLNIVANPAGALIPGGFLNVNPAGASPQGGNYVVGPLFGQSNLTDIQFTFGDLVTSNGSAVTLTDGDFYEAKFWMRPSLFVESGDGEQWYLNPNSLDVALIDGPLDGGIFTVSGWSPDSWTEVNVPFIYDSATMTSSDGIGLVIGYKGPDNSDTSFFQQVGGTGGTPPFLSVADIRTFQVDFGVVPEPSCSILLGMSALGVLVYRKR
jgi:hypothetical protein